MVVVVLYFSYHQHPVSPFQPGCPEGYGDDDDGDDPDDKRTTHRSSDNSSVRNPNFFILYLFIKYI